MKNKQIYADLYRHIGSSDKSSFIKALRIPGFIFIMSFRFSRISSNKYTIIGILSRLTYKRYFIRYGFQIPRKVIIDSGFIINHFGGIVINESVRFGKDCTISNNVSIGHIPNGPRAGCPVFGDRVWIGPGAVIVGGIIVGSNVLIAGNSFVNFSIPSNSIVIGNPGRIYLRTNASKDYIKNSEISD